MTTVSLVEDDASFSLLLARDVSRSKTIEIISVHANAEDALQELPRRLISVCHRNAADCEPVRARAQNGAWVATDSVSEWIVEIRNVWRLSASSTLDLARVVSAAKNRLQRDYGQWSQLWKSKHKMPVSKRTADMLAVIGDQMGGLDSQTSANLPRGWNILYQLARLDRQTLHLLIQEGVIHPKLTLRQAKDLVAEFSGKPTAAQNRKANVRERLRRFAEFVHNTVGDWEIEERESARKTLTELIDQINSAGGIARMGNGRTLTVFTKPAFN